MRLALIVTVLSLALTSTSTDTNLLVNGDFGKGTDNWTGDIRVLKNEDRTITGSVDLSKGAMGVVIDLAKPPDRLGGIWPSLFQSFKSSAPTLNYSITYQVSDDYAPKDSIPNPNSLDSFNPTIDLSQPLPMLQNIGFVNSQGDLPTVSGSSFAIFIFDKTTGTTVCGLVQPTLASISTQVASGSFNNPSGSDNLTAAIVFKPGTGKAVLYHVSITPSNVPASPTPMLDRSSAPPDIHL